MLAAAKNIVIVSAKKATSPFLAALTEQRKIISGFTSGMLLFAGIVAFGYMLIYIFTSLSSHTAQKKLITKEAS